jgi:nucleoid DNA-binding protein
MILEATEFIRKKQDLISELSRSNGLSKAESKKVVERFFGAMADALVQGQRVELRNRFPQYHAVRG